MDQTSYRRVMALWPTGVSVVTGIGPAQNPLGMVIGSFCSVSLAPPLIAFFVKKGSTTWEEIRAGSAQFCVNILSRDQVELCSVFSTGDPNRRFDSVDYDRPCDGPPQIAKCCAWIEATTETEQELGDHLMILGRVSAMRTGPNSLPLAFAHGRLCKVDPLAQIREDHFLEWEKSLNAVLLA